MASFDVKPGDEGRLDETLSFQQPPWMWEVALVQWLTKAQAKLGTTMHILELPSKIVESTHALLCLGMRNMALF